MNLKQIQKGLIKRSQNKYTSKEVHDSILKSIKFIRVGKGKELDLSTTLYNQVEALKKQYGEANQS